jgi:hypothetical protein
LNRSRIMGALVRAIPAAALALALAACSGTGKIACPQVVIMPELQAVAKFGPGPGRQDSDAIYGARMLAVDASCSSDKKKNGVTVATKLGVRALRLKTDVSKGQVTYFAAIIDHSQRILTERDFVIDLEWPRAQRELTVTDELETFVPFAKNASGDDYAILFGFRLTPDELQYNRDHAKPQG